MASVQSVMLVESDSQVIDDVVCSLRLVNIAVKPVNSVAEALHELQSERPALILARAKLNDDAQSLEQLFGSLSTDPQLAKLPVVGLAKKSEEEIIKGLGDRCLGHISLPVEFPRFTEVVQEFLAKARVAAAGVVANAVRASDASVDGGSHTKEGHANKSTKVSKIKPKPSQSAKSPTAHETQTSGMPLDERVVLAYSIQLTVLEMLKRDRNFKNIKLEEIPRLIADVT